MERKHTQGFCIKPDYWRGQAPPSEILGGPVASLAPLVPTPLIGIDNLGSLGQNSDLISKLQNSYLVCSLYAQQVHVDH